MLQKFYRFLMHNQIILGIFLVAFGWLLLQIREILTAIFLAYIIMAALLPAANFLRKKGFPNILAALLPYTTAVVFILLIVVPMVPLFSNEIGKLFFGLPDYIRKAGSAVGLTIETNQIQAFVSRESETIGRNAFDFTRQFFGGIVSVLTILVISFYLLLYQNRFQDAVADLFQEDDRKRAIQALNKINEKLGAWLRGQAILCLSIGIISYIALTILGVPYALPLAIIAGLLEVVPTIGPIIASVPAIIVALTISPAYGLTVAIVYLVIQLLENNLLVPKIMERAVGLNPVVVILAVMIGGNLMGVIGALLAIPFVSFLIVLYKSIQDSKL